MGEVEASRRLRKYARGAWRLLKALEVLKNNNVIPFAIQQFLPSVNNGFGDVIWAGHSMGGHGAWRIATHVPDRALGVVSAAGQLPALERAGLRAQPLFQCSQQAQ